MKLNPENVPASVVPLIAMAEKWGISDDCYREDMVENAELYELKELIHSVQYGPQEDLFAWLIDAEIINSGEYSQEYIAFTNYTMAYESAKIEIELRAKR